MSDVAARGELFWRLVGDALQAGTLTRGTIMGKPCVRRGDDFVAMPHSRTGALVVKLDRGRVQELIEAGTGEEFAPAGRVFKAWVLVPEAQESVWAELIAEATAQT